MHHAREVICLDRCSPSSASSSCSSSCAGSSRMAVAAECPVVLPRVPGKSVWKNFPPGARRKTADPSGKRPRGSHACVSLSLSPLPDLTAAALLSMFPGPSCPATGFFCLSFPSAVVMGPVFFLPLLPWPHLSLVRHGLPYSRRPVFPGLRWAPVFCSTFRVGC